MLFGKQEYWKEAKIPLKIPKDYQTKSIAIEALTIQTVMFVY